MFVCSGEDEWVRARLKKKKICNVLTQILLCPYKPISPYKLNQNINSSVFTQKKNK
jgi:hypothetical protein